MAKQITVAAVNERWDPLVGVEIEMMDLTTLRPAEVQETGDAGTAVFTGLTGLHFFKVRATRHSTTVGGRIYTGKVRLQIIQNLGGFCYDYVVQPDGLGTHTTVQGAVDAWVASGEDGSIFVCPGNYDEEVTVDGATNNLGLWIQGAGVGSVLLGKTNASCFVIVPGSQFGTRGFWVSGMDLICGASSTTGIFELGGADGSGYIKNIRVTNCRILGNTVNIFCLNRSGQQAHHIVFENNMCAATAQVLLHAGQSTCKFVDVTAVDNRLGRMADLATNDCAIDGLVVAGNAMTGGVGAGHTFNDSKAVVISGNDFSCIVADQLFTIGGASASVTDFVISGNRFAQINAIGNEVAILKIEDGLTSLRGLVVVGNSLGPVLNSTNPSHLVWSLEEDDGDQGEWVVANNSVWGSNGNVPANYTHVTTVGEVINSVFGPNAPPGADYEIASGAGNVFIGGAAGTGTYAPSDAQFLTLAADSDLANERVFTPGSGLAGTDGGAGSTYTLNPDWAEVGDLAAVAAAAGAGTTTEIPYADHVHALGIGTTRGDLLVWNATPAASRLAIGGAGTVLQSDGADPAWVAVASAVGHAILDGSVHTDSVADGVTRGSLIVGNATPKWDELVKGTSGYFLKAGADDIAWAALAEADIGDLGTAVVLKSLFDAQTVLAATSDDTPAALTVTEQTLVGRLTGGNVAAIAIGIADNNIVQMDDSDPAAATEFARFTASGIEGVSLTDYSVALGLSGVYIGGINIGLLSVGGSTILGLDTDDSFNYLRASDVFAWTIDGDDVLTLDDLSLNLKGQRELRFYDNGNYVGFEAPALSADQIWVLPDEDGDANQVIITDGSGNLSWFSVHAQAHGPSQHTEGTAWRLTYLNAAGDETEIVLGANGTFLESNGASAAPAFRALLAGDVPDISAAYQAVSGKDAANGYMGLDASGYGAAPPEAHVHDAAGTGGALYSLVDYVFTPDAELGADVATGDQQGVVLHSGDADETVVAIFTDAETAPTGAAMLLEIEFGNTDDLDTVASWTQIDEVSHTIGAKSIKDSSPAQGTIIANRLLRLNVNQVGSTVAGQDVTVTMRVKRPLTT